MSVKNIIGMSVVAIAMSAGFMACDDDETAEQTEQTEEAQSESEEQTEETGGEEEQVETAE